MRKREGKNKLGVFVAELQQNCDKYTTTVTSCAVTAYVPCAFYLF